jgi:HK97 family phage major capsid protein
MIANVRKLKNIATGAYIWQPALTAGTPDVILGYPVIVNNDMTDPAAAATPGGEKSVLFGDFSRAYVIRDVRDFTLMRLQERRAEYFQVVFLGFLRSDAVIQDAHAYRALQQAAA